MTEGTDAQGETMVELHLNGKTARGVGAHTDIIVSSAQAYVAALNRILSQEKRLSPQPTL